MLGYWHRYDNEAHMSLEGSWISCPSDIGRNEEDDNLAMRPSLVETWQTVVSPRHSSLLRYCRLEVLLFSSFALLLSTVMSGHWLRTTVEFLDMGLFYANVFQSLGGDIAS